MAILSSDDISSTLDPARLGTARPIDPTMRKTQRIFQIAAWLLAAAIVVLSLSPPSYRPVTDAPHNLEHFAIFVLTGFAFAIGYPHRYSLNVFGLLGFCAFIEIAQLLVPGRHSRLTDFVVDALATGLGIGTAFLITRAYRFSRR